MPYPPFPSMYNPFLVSEPQIAVPPQLTEKQTVYPQMTSSNQMQMWDEALIGNRLDRIQPIKSIYPDPISSPQILPREYNQPNALVEPKLLSKVETVPDPPLKIPGEEIFYADMLEGMVNAGNEPIDAGIYSPIDYSKVKDSGETKKEDPVETKKVSNPLYEIEKPYWSWQTQMGKYGEEKLPPKDLKKGLEFLSPALKLMTGLDLNNNGDDGDISKLRGDYDGDITNTRSNVEGDGDISYVNRNITNTTNIPPKNKFGTPEAYYLGKSMLDATALINNMVQPQPPSIQMKLPHYERQRLNPEPYDNMRSQMRDQGTQAYRLQRENISQASDLMKGLAAVTSGTQQGLMQVGMQQASADQQIQGINQQISMQEQGAQTQILNQEATTNYQIQAQAQQFKDQMISAQLARLGDTAGAYAKYANMKDIVSKQEKINKAAIQSTNEIQNAMLQYQLQKDAMDSEEYKSAWAQHWNKTLDQMSIDKVKDQKYNLVKEYYGETTPNYSDYRRRATDPAFVQDYYQKRNSYDMFQKLYPGGVAPDRSKYANDADYNTALADFQKYEKDSKAYEENKTYKAFEQEQDFWKTISAEKDEASERKKFADMYMKDRGIFTTEQFMAAIQASLERSQQALEIGG